MNTPKLSPHAVHKLKWARETILNDAEHYDQRHWRKEESCGTVCCIAGIITLGDPEVERSLREYGSQSFIFSCDISHCAKKILELDDEKAGELFHPLPNGDDRFFSNDPAIRAQAGAEHIDRFIAAHT